MMSIYLGSNYNPLRKNLTNRGFDHCSSDVRQCFFLRKKRGSNSPRRQLWSIRSAVSMAPGMLKPRVAWMKVSMKRSAKQIAGNGDTSSSTGYISMTFYHCPFHLPRPQQWRVVYINMTKSYEICDADQNWYWYPLFRKHTKLFPKLEPKITEPTPQHESEIPCIHEDHFFKGKASLLRTMAWSYPPKKSARWKKASLLWLLERKW